MGASWASLIRDWWHSPPVYLGIRSSKWTIGITAFGACFTDGFLYGSIVPVLPFSLVERSGVSEDDGELVNPHSSRRPTTNTQNSAVLAVAALDGLRSLPGPRSSMGFVFSGNTLGLLFSPFLAGIVYDYLGYYAVFIVLFGVITVDVVIRGFMVERRRADRWLAKENKGPDGFLSEAARDGCARESQDSMVAGSEDATPPSPPADEGSPLLHSETKRSRSWIGRLFPTMAVLASSPRLLTAVYGCFTHTMLLACIDSILPLFVKRTFEWTSSGAGAIFLTITCPSVFGTFFGALSDRYGSRIVCLTGIGLNLIFPSLAADLFYEVDVLAETHSETFGQGGAYAQAYSLLCLALGAGTAFGPAWGFFAIQGAL
ncbi:MAG: hypothetical protein Q9178_003864 [Gyalolechia marmorata]